MQSLKIYIRSSLRLTFYLICLGILLAQSNPLSAFAAPSSANEPTPLSAAQQKAISEYPDWIATDNDCSTSSGGTTTLSGSDSEQQAYNYFVSKGLSATQAAAVIGNLMDESHLDPTVLQKGGDSDNPSDAGTDPSDDGWGIAQWSPGAKVIDIAKGLNITTPIYQLATQLNIVWAEMGSTSPTGYQDLIKGLEGITDLSTAVTFFQTNFEGGVAGARQQDAQDAYSKYGNSSDNSGTTVSTTSTTGSCSGGTTIDCSSSASSPTSTTSTSSASSSSSSGGSPDTSTIRQNVVCLAKQQLDLWGKQPGYATAHFPYAAKGYLDYSQNIYEEWCADFASWVYNQAGDPFTKPNWQIASVLGIEGVPATNNNFTWHPESSGYTPQPGDLAIHQNSSPEVSHVNIFISSSGGTSTYIGGDQGQYSPYGAPTPTTTPPATPSESIVSIETGAGYYDNYIIGYVSPN